MPNLCVHVSTVWTFLVGLNDVYGFTDESLCVSNYLMLRDKKINLCQQK